MECNERRRNMAESTSGDDSDIVEHDVKVCDICGDAGREDMLAICSRCSDGAEHTYCMRKMLRKVPGSNWMCEECKFADQEINTVKPATKSAPDPKRLVKSAHAKRVADTLELAPTPKRQALETTSTIGSPRLKPAHHSRSTNDIHETAQRFQPRKGPLFKSKSFNASNSNAKPKVKLVDEVVPQIQKGGSKDQGSVDNTAKDKERLKFMQKSMSFKSGRSNPSDSKVKMLSPRISHTLDSKGSRSMKERNAFDRKNLSKLDRPPSSSTSSSTVSTPKADLAPRAESSLLSFAGNSRELRVQGEGKLNTSKATANQARTSVGVSATTEQKLKDDISFATDKPSSSVDGTNPDRSLDAYQSEKTKETSLRSRSTIMSNSRSTFCQKCKEIGHSAEFCPTGTSEASGVEASGPIARSCREEGTHGVSNLKEAIHAALLRKPEIQRRKRTLDQVEDISTSTTDLNSEISTNKPKMINFGEGAVPRNSTHTDATKPCVTSHGLPTSPPLVKMFAIPEYECIWQGCFEVNGSGSLMEVCGGIQAHLSTCVSPRVPEAVRKFPQKLSLNEVPRLSTWPSQFCDSGAKEDNIALYFFAKDVENYERNYKSLLDSMIKNDLALKGTFEGVELLIFPSNQLPENSQRWNMLFFLWGVFRARRVHSCDSSNQSNIQGNDRMVARNDASAVPENLCLHKLISSECERCSSKTTQDCSEEKQYASDPRQETKAVCTEKKVMEVFGGWKAQDVSVEEKICVVEDCEEKVIAEDFGTAATMTTTTEMRFFPVDPRRPTTDNHHHHKGGGGGGEALGFPNLELALGAETKPPPLPPPAGNGKGMLPFLVNRAIDINDDDDVEDEAVEESGVPASLSLSLSFSMEKQPPQPSKPVSKPPPQVNTSLLLFGGFPDK